MRRLVVGQFGLAPFIRWDSHQIAKKLTEYIELKANPLAYAGRSIWFAEHALSRLSDGTMQGPRAFCTFILQLGAIKEKVATWDRAQFLPLSPRNTNPHTHPAGNRVPMKR